MAGITGLGTTYNLPNYTGVLHQLSPSVTPLFSAIGGLGNGGQTTSTEFEWEAFDLREPDQNVKTEGATAPTAEARVRSNVTNVTQIHQEKVSVSYSKLGATGQKSGTNNDQANPVLSEIDWQVEQALKQMLLDVEWSFINGKYSKPGNNSTPRKTRGLIDAISTNRIERGTVKTGLSAATDTITETSTTVADGDEVVFTDVGASTAIRAGRRYFVVGKSSNAFKVSASKGGSPITIGSATVSLRVAASGTTDVDDFNELAQIVYDNGGIANLDTATLIMGSSQKRALSAAYASAYGGKFVESSRTVGGVNVTTVVTDFGTLNVMVDRYVPADTVILASLDHMRPVYLEVPGKGHFFAEPLAKTGSSDDVQLYGEVGLAYGPETAHGVMTGLKIG